MNFMRRTNKEINKNPIITRAPLWAALLCAALLCTAVLLSGTSTLAAGPAEKDRFLPDPSQRGSLTVAFTNAAGEPDKFGNKVGLYKVADIQVEDGFSIVYDELFESVGDPPCRDAQLGADLAQKLNETAEIKGISLDAPSEEVWSDGKVTFEGTEAGLYLVVQTYRISASDKSLIDPFLVMIPERRADGTLNYDVEAAPYAASNRKAGSESQNKMLAEITPKSKLPKVGAALPGAALIAGAIPFADAIPFAAEILIAGAAMLAAGCVLTRGGKSGY